MNTAFFADKPTARKHDVQKVQTVQAVQNDHRIVRRLERLERLERFERERSDIRVDILSGYPILATYELTVCFGEASI